MMLKPLFAKGKELERPLTHSANAGENFLRCANSYEFGIGQRTFVAESDGAELEYMGPVTMAGDPPWVETVLSLKQAKTVTATLWRAQTFFQWETVTSQPVQRAFHEGIVVERSVGGRLWSVRVADPLREDTLRFTGVSRPSFAAFQGWMAAATRGGLEEFTWVDEERQIARVRLVNCDLVQVENSPRTLAIDLKLAVLAEGEYV